MKGSRRSDVPTRISISCWRSGRAHCLLGKSSRNTIRECCSAATVIGSPFWILMIRDPICNPGSPCGTSPERRLYTSDRHGPDSLLLGLLFRSPGGYGSEAGALVGTRSPQLPVALECAPPETCTGIRVRHCGRGRVKRQSGRRESEVVRCIFSRDARIGRCGRFRTYWSTV